MSVVELVAAPDIGPAIREARRASGLRLEDVAMATGYSVKFLSGLERGKATTPLDMAVQVVRALGGKVRLEFPETGRDA